MSQIISLGRQPMTMSSRDIAELTGKEHSHVMRDIRAMLDVLKKDASSFGGIYEDAYGREQPCFELDRELTLTLVSGYDVELRHRVVTRLADLESQQAPAIPKTYAAALRLAAEQAEQIEQQQLLIEQQKPAVEFVDRYVEARSAKSLREVAKILGVKERQFIAELADAGVIFKQGSNWLPAAEHQHAGRFTVKTGEANGHAYHQTRFTPRALPGWPSATRKRQPDPWPSTKPSCAASCPQTSPKPWTPSPCRAALTATPTWCRCWRPM